MNEFIPAPPPDNAFHSGELHAQQRAGALEKMATIGSKVIRTFMPEQHRQFFGQLPFMLIGSQDDDGQPWASILVGEPGFVSSPDEQRLDIRAQPHRSDPLHDNLREGAALGLLGIEPHTRRRNRANGIAHSFDRDGFSVAIAQSFGNCPKYIQAREPRLVDIDAAAVAVEESAVLTPAMQRIIAAADTFFIATAVHGEANRTEGRHGADVSHRGGKPGFVRIDGDRTLTAPDFVGNFFFNTIGNLLTHPRAGLLFVDFASGDLLYLAVVAEVIWGGADVESYAGAQRLLRFQVTQAKLVSSVLPLRWGEAVQSPFLESMGTWS
ncbi:pyridoxamine 5'-phosphate oxidase family protein [Herbaspirillum sp. RV1423]|uniref:pyridoxamine 5'-phosphate oxidase family protein n=1 Tax=Herbaspirillum sp. RV1423 TaxID=1443993 RepID=UPI0004BAF53B|nr:pyridoxamine 5'-phosphate oxidase family protein [Herbaspirillum sp. RV1423]